jgi:hypothetical protein
MGNLSSQIMFLTAPDLKILGRFETIKEPQHLQIFFSIIKSAIKKKAPCRNKGRLTIACHMKAQN